MILEKRARVQKWTIRAKARRDASRKADWTCNDRDTIGAHCIRDLEPRRNRTDGATSKKKARGKPFPAGNCANPRGRPKGTAARNEWHQAVQRGLTRQLADAWFTRFSASASRGSLKALGAIVKALPAPPADPVRVVIPTIASAADGAKALAAVVAATSRGELSLEQADALSGIIARTVDAFARSAGIAELFAQVEALKQVVRERDAEPTRDPAHPLPWERAPEPSEATGPSDPSEPEDMF
jgi:hypothetical protein